MSTPALAEQQVGDAEPHGIDPQKLLRVATVTHEVLLEIRVLKANDPGAVERLRRLHTRILAQLRGSLPNELYEELAALSPDVGGDTLSEAAIAHAETLGWLEGLFQGTQLALQLEAARALNEQLEHALPDGKRPKPDPPAERDEGTYL